MVIIIIKRTTPMKIGKNLLNNGSIISAGSPGSASAFVGGNCGGDEEGVVCSGVSLIEIGNGGN